MCNSLAISVVLIILTERWKPWNLGCQLGQRCQGNRVLTEICQTLKATGGFCVLLRWSFVLVCWSRPWGILVNYVMGSWLEPFLWLFFCGSFPDAAGSFPWICRKKEVFWVSEEVLRQDLKGLLCWFHFILNFILFQICKLSWSFCAHVDGLQSNLHVWWYKLGGQRGTSLQHTLKRHAFLIYLYRC